MATLTVVVNEKAVELTATQTAANQITVTGTDLTATVSDYSFKLGTATKSLEAATLNEDGSVVLTTAASNIAAGTYTLTFGEAVAEVACAPSKATSIVVEPEFAIMKTTHSAIAYFKVLDQFGTDITKKANLNVTGTDVIGHSTTTGTVEFDCGETKQYNLNLSQLSLAIADKDNGAFYTNVLTVGDYSRLAEATIKGVYKVVGNIATEAKLAEGAMPADLNDYYLLVSGVDQYGLEFDVEKLDAESLSIAFSSVTGLKVTVPKKGEVNTVEIADVEYAMIPLSVETSFDEGLKTGDVTVIGYVLTSGKQLTGTINVGSGVKIASLTINPTGTIYGNTKAVLEYEAIDVDGNSITDIDTLCKFNGTKYFDDSDMYFVGSANGIAKLIVDIDSTETQTMKTLSWMTDTNAYGYTTLTVMPDQYPVAVIGVWTKADNANRVYLGATATSGAINITLKDLKYEDQYGNVIPWWDFAKVVSNSGITVKVTEIGTKTDSFATLSSTIDSAFTPVKANSDAVVLTYAASATAEAITSTAKVKIATELTLDSGVKKSEYTFNVAAVSMNDVSAKLAYGAGSNFYVTNAAIKATPSVKVYYGSTLVSAAAIADYQVVFDTTTTLDPVLVGANASGKGTASVVLKDKLGTTLNIDYTIGNEDPKMAFASIYGGWAADNSFYNDGYATVNVGDKISFAKYVSVGAQYANAGPKDMYAPRITITNLPKNENVYTLYDNGTNKGTISFKNAGYYTLKVTYSWNDGYTYTDIMCFEVE